MDLESSHEQTNLGTPSADHRTGFLKPFDATALARQLVVQLRGEESQRSLSLRLGFSFNQVGKWESGATQIAWADLIEVTRLLKLEVESAFRRFFWTFQGTFDPLTVINYFLADHRFAKGSVYRSAESTRRLKSGEAQVMLVDVLNLMSLQPPLLLGWLSQLTNPAQLLAIAEAYQVFSEQIEIVLNDPLAVFVETALTLDGYQSLAEHDELYLARHATCSIASLRSTLKLLCDHQIIFFDGKKYHSSGAAFGFGSLTSPKLRGLTRYATSLAAQRYSSLPMTNQHNDLINKCVSSVRATAISKDAAEQIGNLVAQFHREVTKVVASDKGPKTNVQVCILHSFASVANAPNEVPEG
jgi:hypothetical protein